MTVPCTHTPLQRCSGSFEQVLSAEDLLAALHTPGGHHFTRWSCPVKLAPNGGLAELLSCIVESDGHSFLAAGPRHHHKLCPLLYMLFIVYRQLSVSVISWNSFHSLVKSYIISLIDTKVSHKIEFFEFCIFFLPERSVWQVFVIQCFSCCLPLFLRKFFLYISVRSSFPCSLSLFLSQAF